ncbi:hypothetical protein LCGC14_0394170 [marine sediment metagenome]|uniref:Uncharacterized protein n=1 Tax=marine sediment metagenome TaxID=412755 RepID=A0A0F9TGP7_9ZZZZ
MLSLVKKLLRAFWNGWKERWAEWVEESVWGQIQNPRSVILAEPISGTMLALMAALSAAGGIGGALLKKTPSAPAPLPTPQFDPGKALSSFQSLEAGLGGRPDFTRFLDSATGRALSGATTRISSAPVLKQAGRGRAQRSETAKKFGFQRTGGFLRREDEAQRDLLDVMSLIGDKTFVQMLQNFIQTQQAPHERRIAGATRIGTAGMGPQRFGPVQPVDNRLSGAVQAGGESAGDFAALMVLLQAMQKMGTGGGGGGGAGAGGLFPLAPPTA